MLILDDSPPKVSCKAWSLVGLLPLLVLFLPALAEEVEQQAHWGDLRINITYDGMDLPKPEPSRISRDVEVMKKFDIVNEQWVIDAKSLGVSNVIAYLDEKDLPVHDSYKETAKAMIPFTFRRGRLDPHVVCVRTSQILAIKNVDPVAYAARCEFLLNPAFHYVVPSGVTINVEFKRDERIPARIADAIHPWVDGWLLVRELPYMGRSDKDGLLEMRNVPAGKRTFRFWHEEVGFLSGLGPRGQLQIEIKPGETRELVVRLRKSNRGTLMKSTTRPIEPQSER